MKLTKSEIDEILSNWSIASYKYKVLKGGVVNNNWVIHTGKKKFVLREVSRFKDKRSLKFEFECLNYLKVNGFKYNIPLPVNTKYKTEFIKYKEKLFWLYEYIDGQIKKELSLQNIRAVAKMMAEYHEISMKKKSRGIRNSTTDPFFKKSILKFSLNMESVASKKKTKDKEDNDFLKMVKVLIEMLKNLKVDNYSSLSTYPLHTDIKGDNLIWNGKDLIGIIDFDNVGRLNDTIIKDIANFVQFSCKSKHKHEINLQKAKLFIDTYRNYRLISQSEINFIPNLIISHYIDFFDYTYWLLQNDSDKVKKDKLYDCFNSAVWVNDNSDNIIKYLL